MSKYAGLYIPREGGFVGEDGKLKHPLIAGGTIPTIMYYIVAAIEYPENKDNLQLIYSELLENYIEKDLLK